MVQFWSDTQYLSYLGAQLHISRDSQGNQESLFHLFLMGLRYQVCSTSFLNPRWGGGLGSRRILYFHLSMKKPTHLMSVEVLWKESRKLFYKKNLFQSNSSFKQVWLWMFQILATVVDMIQWGWKLFCEVSDEKSRSLLTWKHQQIQQKIWLVPYLLPEKGNPQVLKENM